LLKVFLNESGYPHVYVNARRLSEYNYTAAGLYRLLSEALTRTRVSTRLIEYPRGLRGVDVKVLGTGVSVEFNWRKQEPPIPSLLEKFDELAEDDGTYFLVVVDEARELRFLRGYNKVDFRQIIAYSYNNLCYTKLILSSSELGLLYEFLEFNNYTSPLYVRVRDELVLSRFTPGGFNKVPGAGVQRGWNATT